MANVTEVEKGHGKGKRTREDKPFAFFLSHPVPSVPSAGFSKQFVLIAYRGRSSVQHQRVWGGGMGDTAQVPLQSLLTELYHMVHGIFCGIN